MILLVSVPAAAAVGQVVNVASVTADNNDPDTGSNTATVTTTVVVSMLTAPSPSGEEIRASFAGTDPSCSFTSAKFISVTGDASSPPSGSAPTGVSFPHGLFDFTVSGCTVIGGTLDFTIIYPQPLPAGSQIWKYGPTAQNSTSHWYVLPASITANTVSFSITDGGLGDNDLTANGIIVDPSGPGAKLSSVPVPMVSEWLLVLLSLLLLAIGARQMRAKVV